MGCQYFLFLMLMWMAQGADTTKALKVGQKIRLQSVGIPKYFMRRDSVNRVRISNSGRGDEWFVRNGLIGRGISLLSITGGYIRHQGYKAWVHQNDGKELFFKDSSFTVEDGLAGKGISLRSVNYPEYHLGYDKHYAVLIKKSQDTEEYKKSVSFEVVIVGPSK
jgi:hypothetical protein